MTIALINALGPIQAGGLLSMEMYKLPMNWNSDIQIT